MAHRTFVHGIGNKPQLDVLLDQWQIALLDDDGVDLDDMGVMCSMVYWADFLYDKPASPGVAHEASEMELEQSVDAGERGFDLVTRGAARGAGLGRASGSRGQARGGDPGAGGGTRSDHAGVSAGGVPLPSWLKRRLMRVLRRDVHHAGGLTGRGCATQGGLYAANEAISLPAIEAGLRRRPPAPDRPTTDGGPG